MSSLPVPGGPESTNPDVAAGFSRPLRLSARADLTGYISGHLGRLALFSVTSLSVLAVLLIFYFVIQGAFPFLWSGSMEEFLAARPAGTLHGFFADYDESSLTELLDGQIRGGAQALRALHPGETLARIVAAMPEEELRAWLLAQGKTGLGVFLTSLHWYPVGIPAEYGALAILAGSLYVTLGALLLAMPLGVLASIFLSDIAPFQLRQICKPVIEILAAIPSVAYGFFAVVVLAPFMQNNFGFATGTNALNSALILAVMALPTIISVSEDSLSAIGRDIREASYALGATRAETMLKVVAPAAHSGIIAAVILGMMRAIGETMVVWMASGNANQIPSPWWDLSQSIRTMTGTIAGEMGESPVGSVHRQSLFGIATLLLAFTFSLNLISEYFLARVRRTREGRR